MKRNYRGKDNMNPKESLDKDWIKFLFPPVHFPGTVKKAGEFRIEEKRLFLNFLNRFMLYWMKGSSRERRGIASTCRSTGFKLEAGQQWLEVGKWRSFVAIDVAFLANFETQQVKKQYELR